MLIKHKITPYLFLAPAIILFLAFNYIPSFTSLVISFSEYHIFDKMKWIGANNYINMFKDPIFLAAMRNSLQYFIIIVPSLVILPLLIAMLVNIKLDGMYAFRLMYYMPYVVSMVSIAIIWKFLYHPEGLINTVLKMIGFFRGSEPLNWLFNPKTALLAVAILEIWKVCGYYMIIYLAGLQSVSKELMEAVSIDGGGKRHIFFHVIIPTLRPTIAVTMTLAAMNAIQIFTSVYVMTGGGPVNKTISLTQYIYEKAFVQVDMGYASAMGIVLWVILLTLSIINYKLNSRKENAA